jgi:hypothetical protein
VVNFAVAGLKRVSASIRPTAPFHGFWVPRSGMAKKPVSDLCDQFDGAKAAEK